MKGSSMTQRFDHNRTEERPRVSPLGDCITPDVNNEKRMRAVKPEHAAPDWMRITATETRGNWSTEKKPIEIYKKRISHNAIKVVYINGQNRVQADSCQELADLLGMCRCTIERAVRMGRTLKDGERVVAA